jgi:hypothetical protein
MILKTSLETNKLLLKLLSILYLITRLLGTFPKNKQGFL